jgi:uncharacterized protein involved in exopolysaccharide biosynthesis
MTRTRWLVAWTVTGLLAGVAVYWRTPPVYRASTTILVMPQRIPPDMVRSTVATSISERLNVISQVILSRTRLERVIQEFNLYESERKRLLMEDVVALMRQDIHIDIPVLPENQQVRTFYVSFQANHPRTALRVNDRLASLFVQENLEDRLLMVEQTDQFIKGQIEEAKRRLMEREKSRVTNGRAITTWDETEHQTLIEDYKQLLSKGEAARLAARLEARQIAEQLKIIDAAWLPERPIRPRLFPYLVLGALAGISTGALLSLLASLLRRRRARLHPPVAH